MQTLKILAPAAFAPALLRLSDIYKSCRLDFRWGPAAGPSPNAVVNQIKVDTTADAALLPESLISTAIENGHIDPKCRSSAFSTSIGVAVAPRHGGLELDTMARLEAALLCAESIGVSEAGSGLFVRNTLVRLFQDADGVAGRLKVVEGSVGQAVKDGTVDIGFQQCIELMAVAGIAVLSDIPKEARNKTAIEIGALVRSTKQQLVEDFVAFLHGAEAGGVLHQMGLAAP